MTRHARWLALRALAVILIVLCAAVVWDHRTWLEPESIRAALAGKPWAPLAFVGVHVIMSLLFVPRTVMAVASGLLFGLWWGLLWAVVGSMAGAWAGFGLARLLGRDMFGFARLPRLSPWLERLQRGGWRAVWAIRLLPFPHTPVNYAFGLTNIGWGAYSWGSLLGILPTAVFFVAIGAAGGNALGARPSDWILPMAVGVLGLAVSLLLPRIPILRSRTGVPGA